MTTTPSETQRSILTTARDGDGLIRPTPTIRGGAFQKVLQALTSRGWAQRCTVDPDAYHNAFTITDAGRAAVGLAAPTQDPADETPDDRAAGAGGPDDYGIVDGDGYGDSDIPGTEDPPGPGMVFDHERLVGVEPPEGDTAPSGASEPEGDDTPSAPTEAKDGAPVAPTAPTRRADREAIAAAIEALLPFARLDIRHLEGKDDHTLVTGINGTLIRAGDIRRAEAVVAALTSLGSRPTPRPPNEARAPRQGTKQELVIAMLRRPEGATIAQMVEATGWAQHTCRGALAGTLKKKLNLNVVSEKPEGAAERIYRIQA